MLTKTMMQQRCLCSLRHRCYFAATHASYSATRITRRELPALIPGRPVTQRLDATDQDATDTSQVSREPEDVRGAIAIGLSLYEDCKYKDAQDMFEKALNLPGTGQKRYRDKPRLISDGEKQSALYNIACCCSRLEDSRTGLVALAGCLESGYDDVGQLKSDPDLEFLRSDSRFDGLMNRFQLSENKGFLGSLLKGFNL